MRIVVFVRPVHNPAIRIEPVSTRVLQDLPGYQPIPNPMDELALEAALRLKESAPLPVHVSVCSVGRDSSRGVLEELLACGADQALCIEEPAWEPDGAVVAGSLRAFYGDEPFDLGLFGARDLDTDAGEVGPMFSALAGIPYIGSVVDVRWSGDCRIEVTRKQKRLREEIRVAFPACLGMQRGQPLRYPSFWGKLEAASTRIPVVPAGEPRREPRVERMKFTRSKPRKGSVANAYAASSSVDQMRQALGIGGGGAKQDDSLLTGNPGEMAARILAILKKEKLT